MRAEGAARGRSCRTGSFEGNRPTNAILAEELTPDRSARWSRSTSTACSRRASIWGIDSFDQWGVELGKVLAKAIGPELESGPEPELRHDSSTNTLIRRYRRLQVKRTRRCSSA